MDRKFATACPAMPLAPHRELHSESPLGVTDLLSHPYGQGGVPIAPVGGYAPEILADIAPGRIEATRKRSTSFTPFPSAKPGIEDGGLVTPRASVSILEARFPRLASHRRATSIQLPSTILEMMIASAPWWSSGP